MKGKLLVLLTIGLIWSGIALAFPRLVLAGTCSGSTSRSYTSYQCKQNFAGDYECVGTTYTDTETCGLYPGTSSCSTDSTCGACLSLGQTCQVRSDGTGCDIGAEPGGGTPCGGNAIWTTSGCSCNAEPTSTPPPGSTPTPPPPPSGQCPGRCEQPGQCPPGTHEDDNAGTCDNGKVCCVNDSSSGCNDNNYINSIEHIWYKKFDVHYTRVGGYHVVDCMNWNVDDGDWHSAGACTWSGAYPQIWHLTGIPEGNKVCAKYTVSCSEDDCAWCHHDSSVLCWHRAVMDSLTASPTLILLGDNPVTVQLTAKATPGSDGIAAYEWDFDYNSNIGFRGDWTEQVGNGNPCSPGQCVAYKPFDHAGVYNIAVHAADNKGFWTNNIKTASVKIMYAGNWLQVEGGNFYARDALDVSYVPSGDYLLKASSGTYAAGAGVVWASNISVNGNLSQKGWKIGNDAGSYYLAYNDLVNQIVKKGWKLTSGGLNSQLASGIYYREGNLTINSNQNTSGGIILLVKGNLTVAGAVTRLRGIFIVSGGVTFADKSGNEGTLTVEGVMAANADQIGSGNLTVKRYLDGGNKTNPAVRFVYRPDLVTGALSQQIWTTQVNIQEVLP